MTKSNSEARGKVMARDSDHSEARPRLGRGLAALLNESRTGHEDVDATKSVKSIPIDLIRANKNNPRKAFKEDEIESLAHSIRVRGVLQPILVRLAPGEIGLYEIVAGERRWRAAHRAGLHEVPALKLTLNDTEALEIALIENIQRADLNPLEEAQGYYALVEKHRYTQEEVGRIVGKSRSHIANTLRLLNLPDYTKSLLSSGDLSAGHARALVTLADPDTIAKKIVDQGMTVRDVEQLANKTKESAPVKGKDTPILPPNSAETEWQEKFQVALGFKVKVHINRGRVELGFSLTNMDQLEDLYHKILS